MNTDEVKEAQVVKDENESLKEDFEKLKKGAIKHLEKAENWLWFLLITGVALNIIIALIIIAIIIFCKQWSLLIWLSFPLGVSMAVVMSWEKNHSVKLALLHGMLGMVYVIYSMLCNKHKMSPIVDEVKLKKDVFGE